MKTMTLTARSYSDLKPFEVLAKRIGLSVGFTDAKPSTLESYRAKAINATRQMQEISVSLGNDSMTLEEINAVINDVREKQA